MAAQPSDAAQSLKSCMAFDPRDWALGERDAWIWGIVHGWDDALSEVAYSHGWDEEATVRLVNLHQQFERLAMGNFDEGGES